MNMEPKDNFNTGRRSDEVLTPFDVRESSGRSSMYKLLGAFAFLLVLAFVVLKVYQPGTRDRGAPPTISADNTPFKVEPENPGGVETPNQDKTVYDVMDGKSETDAVVTAKTPEEPVKLPKSANIVVEKPETVVPKPTPKPKAEASKPIAETPKPTVSEPAAAPIATGSGGYVVQVASTRESADAQRLWSKLEKDFSDVLGGSMFADIKRADLGDKGIYYRLRVAGLADKDAANKLCSRFKARGQACFVTK